MLRCSLLLGWTLWIGWVCGEAGLSAQAVHPARPFAAPNPNDGATSGPVTVTEPLMRYGLGTLRCAAYSPALGVPFVASAGGIGAILWNVQTGERVRILGALGHHVQCVAFSDNGQYLATGGRDAKARIWDIGTGIEKMSLAGHQGTIRSVVFSQDGTRVLTGSTDGTAKLWNVLTGQVVRTFSDAAGMVNSVAFSPDSSKVLLGSADKTARLMDAGSGGQIRIFQEHTGPVTAAAFTPNGSQILTGSEDGTIKVWSVNSEVSLQTITVGEEIQSLACSADGKYFAAGTEFLFLSFLSGKAIVWNLATFAEIRRLETLNWAYSIKSVSFSPDSLALVVAAGNQEVSVWRVLDGTLVRIIRGHTFPLTSVSLAADSNLVATGGEGSLDVALTVGPNAGLIYNTITGENMTALRSYSHWVSDLDFSKASSRVVTASNLEVPGWGTIGFAIIWDPISGQAVRNLGPILPGYDIGIAHYGRINSVRFSANGQQILTGSDDKTAQLWDAGTGVSIRTFTGHGEGVTSVAFSHDGTKVLTGSKDRTARVWNASSGAVVRSLTGHAAWVYSVAFSPDGTNVLTGSGDCTAKLWDTATAFLPRSTERWPASGFSATCPPSVS